MTDNELPRRGFIVVAHDSPLFPSTVSASVKVNADRILHHVDTVWRVRTGGIPFVVKSLSQARRNVRQVLDTALVPEEAPTVRILFLDGSVDHQLIENRFAENLLLITIGLSKDERAWIQPGVHPANAAHFLAPSEVVPRLIEDLIVDISLANFFRRSEPIASQIRAQGLRGFFRSKAKYFRKRRLEAWIGNVHEAAGYAPLSSLNRLPRENFEGRAESAYRTWLEFAGSFIPKAEAIARKSTLLTFVPQLRGQLPVRRIERVARSLPDGEYVLAILRKSLSARRSPKFRNAAASIFGARARPNSFRFLQNEGGVKDILTTLTRARQAVAFSITIRSGSIQDAAPEA